MYPNLVIDGRGRFKFQRILDRDDLTDGVLMESERKLLDRNKVSSKVLAVPLESATNDKLYSMVVFNDYDTDMDVTFEVEQILGTGMAIKIMEEGSETSLDIPWTKTIPANSHIAYKIKFQFDEDVEYGEIGTIYVKCLETGSDTNYDMIGVVCAAPFIDYTEFETQFEQLTAEGSIFPAGATYDAEEIIKKYIESASEEYYNMVSPLWRIRNSEPYIARQFVIFRACIFCLVRTVVYSSTGANIWVNSIDYLQKECDRLANRIMGG